MPNPALRDRIEALWERREALSARSGDDARAAVEAALDLLDRGEVRVAEPGPDGGWVVNEWLKKAVLLSFRLADSAPMPGPGGAPVYRQGADEVRGLGCEPLRRGGISRGARAPSCGAPPMWRRAWC